MKLIDLTGKRFGRWLVEGKGVRDGVEIFWSCICDCGQRREVRGSVLRGGASASCGCFSRDLARKRLLKKPLPKKEGINLTGRRFGRLLAKEPTEEVRGSGRVWRCLCDCGQEANVPSAVLRQGKSRSCGCRGPVNKLPPGEAKKRQQEAHRRCEQLHIDTLSDKYVLGTLKNTGFPTDAISPDLIEAKRFALSLKRGMKQFQQVITERIGNEQG